jgi:hypothetical protein
MKKTFFSLALLATVFTVSAQVGIGVSGTVDASARFQINANSSTNAKGFLPPQVALTATNSNSPFTVTPATGLLLYNTASAGSGETAVTPGFYYYSGSAWVRLIVPTDNAANVTGTVAVANGGTGSTSGSITGTGALTFAAGGTNQNVTLTPSGTGNTLLGGNVGIGTGAIAPTTKLHVESSTSGSGFRLVDGSQGANKVLSSDASGNASWATNVAVTAAVKGTLSTLNTNIAPGAYTGSSITLPPGKWTVQVNMLAIAKDGTSSNNVGGSYFLQTKFALSSTAYADLPAANKDGPTQIGGLIWGDGRLNMLTGSTIIVNNTSSPITFFYWFTGYFQWSGSGSMRLENFTTSGASENSIIAFPMN